MKSRSKVGIVVGTFVGCASSMAFAVSLKSAGGFNDKSGAEGYQPGDIFLNADADGPLGAQPNGNGYPKTSNFGWDRVRGAVSVIRPLMTENRISH